MPRPRLLRLTSSCTLSLAPPALRLPFLLLFHPLRCLQPRPSENPVVEYTRRLYRKNRRAISRNPSTLELELELEDPVVVVVVANWFLKKRLPRGSLPSKL